MEGARYECTDCAAGKYAKFDGMDHCVTCPEGAYQPLEGADSCSACPDGSQRVATRVTDSGDVVPVLGVSLGQCECMEGYYVLDGTSGNACAKCPDGATCAGNRSLPYPGEGYWTNTRSAAFLGDHYECPIPELCEGLWHLRSCFTSPQAFDNCNASSINREPDSAFRRLVEVDGEETARRLAESSHQFFNRQMCSTGNLGPFCGVCDDGFTKGSGSQGCVACAGQLGTTLGVFFGLLFIIGGGGLWLRWRINRDRGHDAASRALHVRACPARVPRAVRHRPLQGRLVDLPDHLHDQRQPRHGVAGRLRRLRAAARLLAALADDGHHAHGVLQPKLQLLRQPLPHAGVAAARADGQLARHGTQGRRDERRI